MNISTEIDTPRFLGLVAVWAGSLAIIAAMIILLYRLT